MHPIETLEHNIARLTAVLTVGTEPARALARASKSGSLVRTLPGAYSEMPLEPEDSQHRANTALSAACVRQKPRDTLSHASAAHLWGLPTFGKREPIHVIRPSGSNTRRVGHMVHSVDLEPDEIHLVMGIRITSLSRTVLDHASSLPPELGIAVIDHGRALGLTVESLERSILERHQRFRSKLRKLLEISVTTSDSPPESSTRYWVHQAGLHTVKSQHRVDVFGRYYFLDCAVEEIKLAVEFDGFIKYQDPASLYREKIREDAIRSQGWTFMRVTAQDLRNPAMLITQIRTVANALGWKTSRTASTIT